MKQIRIKYYLLIFLALVVTVQPANAEKLPGETIVTQLSGQHLLAGENLWFSVMVSNEKELPGKQISNLVFVEILNSSNQSVIRKKVLLEEGTGAGMIALPESVPSGMYYFVAYTSWMKNFGVESFSISEIMVVQPGDELNINNQTPGAVSSGKINQPAAANLSVQLNKQTYANREEVKLEFQLVPGSTASRVSVAVRKKEPPIKEDRWSQSAAGLTAKKIKFLPDYKGLLLTGFVRNKLNNQPIANQEVFLSFPGENVEVKKTISEENGRFRFLLEPETGEKDMVFYAPFENAGIWLDERFADTLNIAGTSNLLEPRRKQVDFFTEKYINYQLRERFGLLKIKTDTAQNREKNYCFYDEPYQVLQLKDYIQLDSLHEYFYELIPSVHLSRKNKKYVMRLTNPVTHYTVGNNPAIFIDGVYYPNPGALMNVDADRIDRIEVIPEVYYYRDMTFDGIVSVFTKDAGFIDIPLLPNMTRVFYDLTEKDIIKRPLQQETEKASNVPDLRWLIYWTPELPIDAGHSSVVRFSTSDLTGEFEVLVKGITDSGEKIQAYTTFKVE